MKQWGLLVSFFVCAAVSFADISVTADANDQQWTTDGSSTWINQTSGRVGSQTTDQLTGQVLPFLLPDLSGQTITDVSLDFTATGGNIGNLDAPYNSFLDLVAPNAGAVESSLTSVADLSGTVLVDNYLQLTVANFPASTVIDHTVSGGTLTGYLQDIYANDPDAAGKYVVLTLVPDTPIRGGRYFTMNTANASSGQPVLHITASSPQVVFTESPSAVSTNNGDGTVTFTLTLGVADADPAPVLSGELTLDGNDVTGDVSNLTYTVTQIAQPQELIWTVTATNGVYQDAVFAVTSQIASLYGTAPDQVTGLTVDAGDASVSLSWTAPADNGEPITGYLIEVDSGSGFASLAASATTNYLHTSASNDVTYTYRVAATNGLGAIGLFSDSASGTPEEFLLAPSFIEQPIFACANNGDGTLTCALSTGTVTGAPPPVVTGVLMLDDMDVTGQITNGLYTAVLAADPQTLVWTVTASNGIGSNAVFSDTQIVPSSEGITLNEFSRNMTIFDSDCARGNNRADIPVSGTVASNGAVIEVRAVIATNDSPISGFDWQEMAPASGGAWSGTYTGVTRTVEWLRMEARVKNQADTTVQMSNTFAAGYVVFIEDQSNTHQGLKPGLDFAAINAAAAGDPFPVTIGNEIGDFQFVWLNEDGNTPTPVTYISDANPHTTSLAAMAETFAKTAPGMKVMIGFDTLSGSAPAAPLRDGDTSRAWSNSVWLAEYLQADGSEVGIVWADHYQGTTDGPTWLVGAYLGYNLDGTVRSELELGLEAFPSQEVSGSWVNHIWLSIYPGLLTGRMQILRNSQGNTYAKEITSADFDTTVGNSPLLEANFAEHFTDETGFFGQLIQPEGDVHWDKTDVERGYPQKLRYMACQFLRAGDFISVPVPTIDHVDYTPEHITVWSDAGPITTVRLQKGLTNNYPVDPTADPLVEGGLQVIGFTDELIRNVARTEIVDEVGNPATEGRIRIYPHDGELFDDASQIFYLIARSGYQEVPGVSQQQYTDSYLYDSYPIVDIGVPTIYGQSLTASSDKFSLAKLNDLSSDSPSFTVESSDPTITGSGYLASQSSTNYTVEIEFRRWVGQPFYVTSADNTYWTDIHFWDSGSLTVKFRNQSGEQFSGTVSADDVPDTIDGFHTFRIAFDLGGGRIDLFMDDVPFDDSTTPQFGTNTVLGTVTNFRGGQNANMFDFSSSGDVRRFRAWGDVATGGDTPTSTPWLEIVASATGAFTAPAGGDYNVLDNGVIRIGPNTLEDDVDSDGLPNEWEELYFGGSTNANPSAMAANGQNTVREAYIAGLNPTNAASRFTVSNDWKTLGWTAVSGRVYSVYWTTNLLEGFQPLETNILWPQSSWTGQAAEVGAFYKLEVRLNQP